MRPQHPRPAATTVRHHHAASDHAGRLGSLGPRHGPHADAHHAPAEVRGRGEPSPGRLPRAAEPRGSGPHWPPATAAVAEAVSVPLRARGRTASRARNANAKPRPTSSASVQQPSWRSCWRAIRRWTASSAGTANRSSRSKLATWSIPARLVYEDDQLDLPRQPGPDAVSVAELRWRTAPVRLELTIWRPYEFSQQRLADRIQHTPPESKERLVAVRAQSEWKDRAGTGIHADPHAYFVEVHSTDGMPWFMGPATRWHARLTQDGLVGARASGGAIGVGHAGVGTPVERLVSYLGRVFASDRQCAVRPTAAGVCFEPEALYRGVLFGTAIVTLMLTADARIHEILQISVDRFVKPGPYLRRQEPRRHTQARSGHQPHRHGRHRRTTPLAERPPARRSAAAVRRQRSPQPLAGDDASAQSRAWRPGAGRLIYQPAPES